MSVCSECGSVLPAEAKVCYSCGSPTGLLLAVPPELGLQRRFVGTWSFWKVVSGFSVILAGGLMASLNSGFEATAVIIIVVGVILLALGVIGAKTPVEQVVYQT